MRENKTYSSRYVACSEAMFETGGADVNWRNPSKTCRTLRGSAMPIGTGSDTFLKISGIFVASGYDPNCQNSQFSVRVIPSATNPSRTRDEAPAWAFFLFGSKGFNEVIRLSETDRWPEIRLRTPRVSFHPPFTQIETHSKLVVFSDVC